MKHYTKNIPTLPQQQLKEFQSKETNSLVRLTQNNLFFMLFKKKIQINNWIAYFFKKMNFNEFQ
jgi:hypothetical protein